MASNAASRLDNVPFGGGNSKYNLAGETARNTFIAKGWTFTDGGLSPFDLDIERLPGINITDPITLGDEFEEFPTHYDIYGYGGYHCVQNIEKRNTIPSGRRKEGMIVFTIEDNKNWILSGSINNSNWSEIIIEKEYKNLFFNKFDQDVTGVKNFILRPDVTGKLISLPGDPEASISFDGFNIGAVALDPQTNSPHLNLVETPRINDTFIANTSEVSPSVFTCSHSFYSPNQNGETVFFNQFTNLSPSRSDSDREFQFPFGATIISASLTINMATTGISENFGSISIIDKTNKVHYELINNITYNFTRQSFIKDNLNIHLEANKNYAIRVNTPNFVLRPNSVRHQLNLSLVNSSTACTSPNPNLTTCPEDGFTYDKLGVLNNSGCIIQYLCTPRFPAFIPPVLISNYILKQQIFPGSDPSQYGSSIAMSDDESIIILGAPNDLEGRISPNGFNVGAILIYTGSKIDGWNLKQKLLGDNLAGAYYPFNDNYYGESLGTSVSTNSDGSIILAGTRQRSTFAQTYGGAKVYTGSKEGGWQLQQILTPPLISNAIIGPAWFGTSTAVNGDGNILAIGGPQYHITGILDSGVANHRQGAVALYTGNMYDGWEFKQMVTGNSRRRIGIANGIRAGWSTDINNEGNVLVVGSPTDAEGSRPGFGNGSIIILTGNPNNGWNVKEHIFEITSYPSGFQRAQFGVSVSIAENNIIAVGASKKLNSSETEYIGGVYIYSGSPQGNWSLVQSIDGNGNNSNFGQSLHINKANGNSLLVGSPFLGAGVTYLYDKKTSLNFTPRQTFFGDIFSVDILNYGRSVWISNSSEVVTYTSPNDGLGVGSLVIFTGKY
jgi:hypothetical protein